ncbi:MAG: hypothetical protein OSJ65_04585 [Bacilli bacterium]|nr:hypothetical protein [Bacilli bacterium]
MKNIIIIGPSRTGKSTLASLVCKKYNLSYISGDSIRNAFIKIYPELGYSPKTTIDKIEFCQFIEKIINENSIHLKRQIFYVIDSADISIDNAKGVFKDSLIIGLGCKDAKPESMLEKIKENDTELEWTYGYSDKDLLELINSTIRKSKSLYDKCTLNNIPYFETSLDRYNAYNDVYKYIENELDL